jgi:hypothetical protein
MIRRVVFAACALALGGCAGKGTEGTCGDATASCSGSPGAPMGTWSVAGACSYQAVMPTEPMGFTELNTHPLNPSIAPPQSQPTTDGNWCYDLIVKPAAGMTPSTVSSVNLWHDVPSLDEGSKIKASTVAFNPDHTYAVDLTFAEKNASTHFTPFCLQYQGNVSIQCGDLATEITAFYTQAAGTHPVAFQNIQCNGASDGGCDCIYNYSVEVTDSGTWLQQGNLLEESSANYLYNGQAVMSQAPSVSMLATYCQSGTSLIMSGYEGTNLSNVAGLRTLSLTGM